LTVMSMTCAAVSCKDSGKKANAVELNDDGDDDEAADDDAGYDADEADGDDAGTDDDESAGTAEANGEGGVALTFENMAGVYESLDDDFNSESRLVLEADGTASWCMIGSLTISEYTYTISGNTICLSLVGFDDDEKECYEYNADERALKNAEGAVFYRQIEE